MKGSARDFTRRSFVLSALTAAGLRADGGKGAEFETQWRRYADPSTELTVLRLTDPEYSSLLPPSYNRAIARNSSFLLFSCDRSGSPQAFRMDLKTGATEQLTEAGDLDGRTLALMPDNRSFLYMAGRELYTSDLAKLRERKEYELPEGWNPCGGVSLSPDGRSALVVEQQGEGSRIRMAPLSGGAVRTLVEAPFALSAPAARPVGNLILYRQGSEALWLVGRDGKGNRKLKLPEGRVGQAAWSPDGHSILYLHLPAERTQLNAIREYTPEADTDKLVSRTSQFVDFGFNADTSVFIGASRNTASPTILILLRVTHRELTVCEHKASHPDAVGPRFAPDSQRIYFQSDRHGRPAIYSLNVERLVEKTEGDVE